MRRGEDLTGLWQAKERGCEKAREKLILRFEVLVYATRLKRIRHAPLRLHEEMESAGRIMLIRCVDEYDRSLGVQFPTYAITKIWGAMTTVLRDDDWTPRVERERERDGKPCLIREVVSFEDLVVSEVDTVPDPGMDTEAAALAAVEASLIRTLVGYLPRKEREMLVARYWHGLSMTAYGELVDRGMSRIAQREATALGRLRSWLERTGGIDAAAVR
jgi:RNA polymerase sigma factor (sigma-70 family)